MCLRPIVQDFHEMLDSNVPFLSKFELSYIERWKSSRISEKSNKKEIIEKLNKLIQLQKDEDTNLKNK